MYRDDKCARQVSQKSRGGGGITIIEHPDELNSAGAILRSSKRSKNRKNVVIVGPERERPPRGANSLEIFRIGRPIPRFDHPSATKRIRKRNWARARVASLINRYPVLVPPRGDSFGFASRLRARNGDEYFRNRSISSESSRSFPTVERRVTTESKWLLNIQCARRIAGLDEEIGTRGGKKELARLVTLHRVRIASPRRVYPLSRIRATAPRVRSGSRVPPN